SKTTKSASKSEPRLKQPKTALRKQGSASRGFHNPFRIQGGYWASVEAMRALGIGKMHPFDQIVRAVQTAMGADAWKAFAEKPQRNAATAKDAKGRTIQNIGVLGRHDMGKP